MSDLELDAIRQRAEAAAILPSETYETMTHREYVSALLSCAEDVPALLDEADRLRAERDEAWRSRDAAWADGDALGSALQEAESERDSIQFLLDGARSLLRKVEAEIERLRAALASAEAYSESDTASLVEVVGRVRQVEAERDEARAEVERLLAEQPDCDGDCNEEDGPDEECSLHGYPVAEVWAALHDREADLSRVQSERDALAATIERVRRLANLVYLPDEDQYGPDFDYDSGVTTGQNIAMAKIRKVLDGSVSDD